MKVLKLYLVVAVLIFGTFSLPIQASPTRYPFFCITNNDPSGTAGSVGEAAFYLDVSDAGSGQVLFEFGVLPDITYFGTLDYYIDGIYFYDGRIFAGIETIIDADVVGGDPGVDFEPYASPHHLPGFDPGNYPTLVQGVLIDDADAEPSANQWGIGPGESLGVLYNIYGTYDGLIAAMNSGAVIIGIKAQGFGEFSESFIIPAPGAILLGGIGVVLVGWLRRRKTL